MIKKPNNFNIFQDHRRTDIVMNDMGCGEYRPKFEEIYGGSVLVRSFGDAALDNEDKNWRNFL